MMLGKVDSGVAVTGPKNSGGSGECRGGWVDGDRVVAADSRIGGVEIQPSGTE